MDQPGAPASPKTSAVTQDGTDPLVSDEDRKFWSFQPPKRPAVPTVQHQGLVRTPIDAFLLQKLEAKKSELFSQSPSG